MLLLIEFDYSTPISKKIEDFLVKMKQLTLFFSLILVLKQFIPEQCDPNGAAVGCVGELHIYLSVEPRLPFRVLLFFEEYIQRRFY